MNRAHQPTKETRQLFGKFWKSGDLEIQNFEVQEMQKMKILKIQIRSAQNVGKVWISTKKIILALFGAI